MKKALILEDYRETREFLVSVVHEAFPACEVKACANINEASRLVMEQAFDLALVDLNLPDGSGIDIIGKLSAHQPQCFTVVATIYDDDQNLMTSLKAGASGYLLKDNPKNSLVESLRAISRGQPPLSPSISRRILRLFSRDLAATKSVSEGQSLIAPATLHVETKLEQVRDAHGASTTREAAVLSLLAMGLNRTEISDRLEITVNTAASHVKNIYRKLNIDSRAEAALFAQKLGLLA